MAPTTAPHPDSDDRDLLARVCRQDAAAHRVLFDRYYGRIFAFVLRRLRDSALAEEIVADVFFEVWRSAERFSGESKVSTWMFGIAQFKSMTADRNRRRAKRRSVIPTNVEILHAFPDTADAQERIVSRAELRRLMSLVDTLPEGQQDVIKLAFIEELDYEEIAKRLGISQGTVKSRIARARNQLRQGLRRQAGTKS